MSAEHPEIVDTLTRALIHACRKIGEAGHPRDAGHLLADAWVALGTTHPRQAQLLNGAMHHIARLDHSLNTPTATTEKEPDTATTDRVLDVRSEIPSVRHQLILDAFTKLSPGTAYVLINDHDPQATEVPAHRREPGRSSWEYLEEGPEIWRVRIGRTSQPETRRIAPASPRPH